MKKEKIAFFLGSSIDEFQKERKDLKSFALDNNRLLSRVGVEIEFYLCEDAQDKSQTAIDAYIQKNADVCIFLLGKTVGDVTDHEIGIAGEVRKQTGNVRPVWQFFAKSDSTLSFESVSREVKDYADKINKTYGGQYVTPFFNSAEMKITILQSALLKLDRLKDLSAEDGKLTLNGVVVSDISFDDIPEYANNRNYRKLKSEIEELEQRFQSLDPKTQMQEMLIVSGQINEKTSLLRELEKETVGVMNSVFLRLREDHVDETVKKTYALLREGKLEEAKECISLEELRENDAMLLGTQTLVNDGAKKNVEQAQARIDVWKTDAENPERFDEIQKTYESVWNSILISDSFGMGIDYFDFLLEQNRHEDADEMIPRLTAFIEDHHAPNEWKANAYNDIGCFYTNQNRPSEAEACHQNALAIRQELVKSNPEKYNGDLATSYNNLGALFYDQNRLAEAEEYFQNALEIQQELAKSNPEKYNGNLAMSYNNLGALFGDQNRLAEAEEYFQNALTILQELAKSNPEKNKNVLEMSYNDLGALFYKQNRLAEAEECYQNALEIQQELAKSNPEKYNDDLATSYNNLGALFHEQNRLAEAEACHQNALAIQQELAKSNPEKYNGDLAESYNNLGALFYKQNRLAKAEACHQNALAIRQELAKSNPEKYNEDLATSYSNIGGVSYIQNRLDEAESCYQEALEIWQELAKSNPERYYNEDLATSYNNLGELYCVLDRLAEAEACHQNALAIWQELAKSNPEKYNGDLATSYSKLGALFYKQNRLAEAEACHQNALAIRQELVKSNPEKYNVNLAESYNNLGALFCDRNRLSDAEVCYQKALSILQPLVASNPERYTIDTARVCANYGYALSAREARLKCWYRAEELLAGLAEKTSEKTSEKLELQIQVYASILKTLNPKRESALLQKYASRAKKFCPELFRKKN